jgi:subfamily B ATP-binding cassette protein MsbA
MTALQGAVAAELSGRALALRLARTYLKPRWPALATALVCAAFVALISTQFARLIEPAVNELLVERNPVALWQIPLAMVVLALARTAAQLGQATIVNRIGHRIVGAIQVQLFGRLIRADLARLRAAHTGKYVSAVLFDAGLIREAATTGVVNYTQHGLIVVGMLAWMAFNDLWLTLVVLTVGPLLSLVMRRFSKRTRKATSGAMAETSALSSAVMESLDGIKIVKIENREAAEEARVAAVVDRRQRHIVKGANVRAAAAPVTEALTAMMMAAVFAYAGWRARSGGMNVGEFTAFLFALGLASQSLRQLTNLQTVMSEGLTAARRLFSALDVEDAIREVAGAPPLKLSDATVRFDGVRFAYDDGGVVLAGVDLEVRRGETVALVGPSGGGKSTILSLIPRFYDVTGGAIRIDGQDIRKVTVTSLRANIALVTQEPFLFDDTVRGNIAYGRPEASAGDVEAAARAADAHDFIAALPQGYDTLVGEAGARLSGGQRQRIAIARAFLKDAPILLLDEATSALDTESEAKVQAALNRLMAGRTTLLIAHRLSTVRSADRIYVIEAGRVVEHGSHPELVARPGLYARLAGAQPELAAAS